MLDDITYAVSSAYDYLSPKTESVSPDAEPPSIQCPNDIVAGTDERRGTAIVNWNVPTAADNSNDEVGCFRKCI